MSRLPVCHLHKMPPKRKYGFPFKYGKFSSKLYMKQSKAALLKQILSSVKKIKAIDSIMRSRGAGGTSYRYYNKNRY